MIVDTHIHYMQPPDTPGRPWDAAGTKIVVISAEDLIAQAVEAGIDKIVHVAASTMGWDNRYAMEGYRNNPDRVAGVFGRLDPVAPDVDKRLAEFMAEPGALGIRIQLRKGGPSEQWLRNGGLDPFLRAAASQNVTVSIYAPNQPKELHAVIKQFPDVRWIVEHMTVHSGPGVTNAFDKWADVLALAKEPNAWVKVSYFPEGAPDGERFPFPTAIKRFRELYEHVGASRMIWASNYPPSARVCTYSESLEFVRKHCTFFSSEELDWVLGLNFMATFVSK